MFEAKAFAQILQLALMLLQEVLVMRPLKGRGIDCRCGGNHWQFNGDFNRRIRTRIGAVELPFRCVSCRVCGLTHSPLQRPLKLGRYQTKTNELEKPVVETVGETSKRRGVAQLSRDCGLSLPSRIAHGWSDREATENACIILKRFAKCQGGEDYWRKVFGDDLSVVILLKKLKGNLPKKMNLSQDFAH